MSIDIEAQLVTDQLGTLLAASAPQISDLAPQLANLLQPSLRLALQNLLDESAQSLGSQLDGTAEITVELQSGEPVLIGKPIPTGASAPGTPSLSEASPFSPAASAPTSESPSSSDGDENTSRFTLRLPEGLKARAEGAAAQSGQSLNTWVIQALNAALNTSTKRTTHSLQGWIG